MKTANKKTISRLEQLPNIGPAMGADLRLLNIRHPRQLIGKDPLLLYGELCRLTKTRHDPCVIDVFMSAIHFMEGGEARPWWSFTDERKKRTGN